MRERDSKSPGRSRRSFVVSSVAAVVGATQAGKAQAAAARPASKPLAKGRVLGANDRINVAYVGTGSQGMTHVRNGVKFARDNNIAPVAVCDVYDKRLQQAQKAAGLADKDAVRDYRRLLERKDIDAVVVSTVDTWHADVAVDALDAGKHVYGEKPLSRYLDEGFRVYDAVKRTGLVFQIGSQFCVDEKYHEAAKWIREGRIGPLVTAQGSYCRNHKNNSEWTYPIDPDANPKNVDWNRWLGKAPKVPWNPEHYFSWHKFYAYNSGILGNLLSHTFLPLLLASAQDDLPRLVTCTGTRKVSTDREITDTTQLFAEMPSGLTFIVTGSTVNEQGLPPLIRGLKGTIYLPLTQNVASLQPERPYAELIEAAEFSHPNPPASVPRLEADFFRCIRTGDTPAGNIDLALRAHVILAMAETSQRLGMTLHLDPATRSLRSGDGRKVDALDYASRVPAPKPMPLAHRP